MKTLVAILKDSYREAVSGWMLQVMLALAVLLILFVFSVSFEQASLKEQFDTNYALTNSLIRGNPALGSAQMGIENYSEANPVEPWKSAYQFDFVIKCPSADDLKKAREAGLPTSRYRVQQQFEAANLFEGLEVVEVKDSNAPAEEKKDNKEEGKKNEVKKKDEEVKPAEARFRVTATSTKIVDKLAWPHRVNVLFFIQVPIHVAPREAAYLIQNWLVNGIGAWVTLLIGVIITAGFIPNMLSKGSLDLIISKPVSRVTLLCLKYLGGLTFVFLVTSFTVLGVFAAIGLRTGIWSSNFLLVIPILTMYFAILYAVSTVAALLSRNALVAILLTGVAWFLFWAIGKVNDGIQNRERSDARASERLQRGQFRPDPEEEGPAKKPNAEDIMAQIDPNRPLWGFIPKSSFPIFTALHAVTPRTYELDSRLGRVLAQGTLTERELKELDYDEPPRSNWFEMLAVSWVFILLMLGLASWRFVTRDG